MGMSPTEAIARIIQLGNEKPVVLVMAGVQGSGKSTFIEELKTRSPYLYSVASTDNMVEAVAKERGLTYSQVFGTINFKDMNKAFKVQIRDAGTAKANLIIDRTNVSKKARRSCLDLLGQKLSYTKVCVTLDVGEPMLFARLKQRAETTGKVMGFDIVKSKLKAWETPTKDEGFDLILNVDNG